MKSGNYKMTDQNCMGKIKKSEPVKLIVGMFSNQTELFTEIKKFLEEKFGPVDYESQILSFDNTNYYEKEMGKDLKRIFYSFEKLINPENLAEIKIFTNRIEEKFSVVERGEHLKRKINIDPGYLTLSKLVLASTKDYSHRVYLQEGIYAETTLKFEKGSFTPYEYTYPDYRTPEYINIFNQIRQIYLTALHP